MNKRNRSRAYVRAAAESHRSRRLKRLEHEWGGWRYNTTIEAGELRRDLASPYWSWRTRGMDPDRRARIERALQLPELSWPTVQIDHRLIKLLGTQLMQDLAPWSFSEIAGLDQRLSYRRMDVEPEWTLPDIVRAARPVRKRVWQRDEIIEWDEDDYINARRHGSRTQLYDRWAGGELRT